MRKSDKRPAILDRPTFSLTECRYLLGMELKKWRDLWNRKYVHKVEHIETTNGWRIDVESLVAALFPKIAKDPLALAKMTIEMIVQNAERAVNAIVRNCAERFILAQLLTVFA